MTATDGSDVQKAFTNRAEAWDSYRHTPLGRLREDLVIHNLRHHLDAYPPNLKILDAGGGTGGYALDLARKGHRVFLLDFSESMLDVARQNAADSDPGLLERIEFCCAPVQEI